MDLRQRERFSSLRYESAFNVILYIRRQFWCTCLGGVAIFQKISENSLFCFPSSVLNHVNYLVMLLKHAQIFFNFQDEPKIARLHVRGIRRRLNQVDPRGRMKSNAAPGEGVRNEVYLWRSCSLFSSRLCFSCLWRIAWRRTYCQRTVKHRNAPGEVFKSSREFAPNQVFIVIFSIKTMRLCTRQPW